MDFRNFLGGFAVLFALSLTGAIGSANTTDHPVIRSGNGVDHATVLTRSLVRTSKTFSDLGFTVSPLGSYDSGFENSTMWFADGTYLELFGVHDPDIVAKGPEAHAIEAPEGLTWVTLDTSSIDDTVKHLKNQGHAVFGPETIPAATDWSYKLAGMEKDTLPGHRFYFIEYNDVRLNTRRQAKLESWRHKETRRNTALGLQAAWVAVRNLADAEKLYRNSGFTLGRRVDLPHLKAVGREISTGGRAIMLIEPSPDSPASQLVKSRPAAFIGSSVRVQNLAKAKSVLAENNVPNLTEYAGPYGRSLLIPPAKAGGSWVELFE